MKISVTPHLFQFGLGNRLWRPKLNTYQRMAKLNSKHLTLRNRNNLLHGCSWSLYLFLVCPSRIVLIHFTGLIKTIFCNLPNTHVYHFRPRSPRNKRIKSSLETLWTSWRTRASKARIIGARVYLSSQAALYGRSSQFDRKHITSISWFLYRPQFFPLSLEVSARDVWQTAVSLVRRHPSLILSLTHIFFWYSSVTGKLAKHDGNPSKKNRKA